MSYLKILSPAKINLCLHILGRRRDGYHNLSMLMEKVSLCDELTFEKIPSGIEVLSETLDVPVEENLVTKAARLFQEVCGTSCGVRIHLAKKIPMGGGLGGGSSDAAAVLKGLNELWGLHWPISKLAAVGVKLGADVPFFIYDGPAKVEGIGEQITPLKKFPKLWIILINPGVHVATPNAYNLWDQKERMNLTQQNQSVRDSGTFEGVIQVLHNDFESVVIPEYPAIQMAKDTLLHAGASGALMSGSGSTVFGLFETKEKRDRALKKIKTEPKWQVFAVENWGVDKR